MKFSAPILIVGFGSIGKRHTNNLLSQTNSLLIILSKRNDIKDFNKSRASGIFIRVCAIIKPVCESRNPISWNMKTSGTIMAIGGKKRWDKIQFK